MNRLADCVNLLGRFCGMRDVPSLTPEALQAAFGLRQADVMVLFGGSILCGGDLLARSMQLGVARNYIIVGGEGHTTESLRRLVHEEFPPIETHAQPEAVVFARYLQYVYGLQPDYLECRSTNCGNNITNLLALLDQNAIPFDSIILCQDASMQRRMDAGLRKHIAPGKRIINYAVYAAEVEAQNSRLIFRENIRGMWDMERYISLLLGEIPRLADNADGYGPAGSGYIAHVDIPSDVQAAFEELCRAYPGLVRSANPLYASARQSPV